MLVNYFSNISIIVFPNQANSHDLLDAYPMRWARFLLAFAYTCALLPSVMQLLIWLLVTPEPETYPNWHQCTTLWHHAYYAGKVNL